MAPKKTNLYGIDRALDLLSNNEVVGVPTETVYGLAGAIDSEIAIKNFIERKIVEGFSDLISLDIIKENEYNLSVTKYIFQEDKNEDIDIKSLNEDIRKDYQNLISMNNFFLHLF